MGSYIAQAKEKITTIADQITAAFPGIDCQFAFVAYRDHCSKEHERLLEFP